MMKKWVILWWMLFVGIVVNVLQGINLNIAVISIVKPKTAQDKLIADEGICISTTDVISFNGSDSASQNNYYEIDVNSSLQAHQDEGLSWDEHEQNLILGGFFWLAWSAQFFGGILSHKFGGKLTFGLTTFIACALSLIIPKLAYLNFAVVLVVRVLQGFLACLGVPPGIVWIIGQWSPPEERGKFMSVLLGISFGTAVGYPIYGTVGENFGWESIFYLSALMGIIWYVLWLMVVFDSPEAHPTITMEEKKYIQDRMGSNISNEKLPIPWKSILISFPFWINVFCQFGIMWCVHSLNIYLPSYLRFVHGLDMKIGGYIAGVIFTSKSIVSIFAAWITDYLIREKYMSAQNVRNLSVVVSCMIGGGLLLAVPFAECDIVLAVIFLLTGISLHGFFIYGVFVAILDMSPNFSSVLQGIAGTLAATSGFLSPLLIDQLPFNNYMMEKWDCVFYILSGFSIGTGIIFVLLSDSTLQSWNSPEIATKLDKNSVEMGNGVYKQTT